MPDVAASPISFLGGLLLGLASSLHCVGMCGGITLMLGLPVGSRTTGARIGDWLALHGGRALSYVALGGLAGGIGGAVLAATGAGQGHALLRWGAAFSLGWVGLSLAGLTPSPAAVGHRLLPRMALPRPSAGRVGLGLAWGLLPCGMVHGALLYALFAGSAAGGASVMLGFAMGTVPALLGAQAGFAALRRLDAQRLGQRGLGILILLAAMISLADSGPGFGQLCASIADRFWF